MDDLDAFVMILPSRVQDFLDRSPDSPDLTEVVMDLGRPPQIRYLIGQEEVGNDEVTSEDIQHVVEPNRPFRR